MSQVSLHGFTDVSHLYRHITTFLLNIAFFVLIYVVMGRKISDKTQQISEKHNRVFTLYIVHIVQT